VGDQDFQQKCIATMQGFLARGRTILFVSHSPLAVTQMCTRVCVLDAGRLVFDGDVHEGLARYDEMLRVQSEPDRRVAT
jgi:ABC-type polysaccharide/polyol phosphate transport system ATPase subunit